MRDETFANLVTVLASYLTKQDTLFRRAIPVVDKRVAIAVWRLATGNSYRSIAKTFAVGNRTAVKITHEFCSALVHISDMFIHFTTSPV